MLCGSRKNNVLCKWQANRILNHCHWFKAPADLYGFAFSPFHDPLLLYGWSPSQAEKNKSNGIVDNCFIPLKFNSSLSGLLMVSINICIPSMLAFSSFYSSRTLYMSSKLKNIQNSQVLFSVFTVFQKLCRVGQKSRKKLP